MTFSTYSTCVCVWVLLLLGFAGLLKYFLQGPDLKKSEVPRGQTFTFLMSDL